MKEYILDTNILLRFLLRDIESQYQKAESLLKKASGRKVKLMVPQVVIFEVEFALRKFYGFKKKDVIEKIESLVSSWYLKVETRDVFLVALRVYQDKSISFVDCFLKSYASVNGAKLVSFDKKL